MERCLDPTASKMSDHNIQKTYFRTHSDPHLIGARVGGRGAATVVALGRSAPQHWPQMNARKYHNCLEFAKSGGHPTYLGHMPIMSCLAGSHSLLKGMPRGSTGMPRGSLLGCRGDPIGEFPIGCLPEVVVFGMPRGFQPTCRECY